MRDLKRWLVVLVALSGLACGSNDGTVAGTPNPGPQPAPSATPLPRGPGLLYVMLTRSILRYANPSTLSGAVAPQAEISSDLIVALVDMTLDPVGDRLYAANAPGTILVWDQISTRSGSTPPDRIINFGVNPSSVAYDRIRDVLYVGSTSGIFRVFGASTASGSIASGLPLVGSLNGQPLFPFDIQSDPLTNRLVVSSCSTVGTTAPQVVATFNNAFQSTGNSTFTSMTSAINPFATTMDAAGRLVVNDAIEPFVAGIQMSTQERILVLPSNQGNPPRVLTITGAAQSVGAHRLTYDTNDDSLIVANTDKLLFFDRFTTLTGTIAASTARRLDLSAFNSTCTDTAYDPTR